MTPWIIALWTTLNCPANMSDMNPGRSGFCFREAPRQTWEKIEPRIYYGADDPKTPPAACLASIAPVCAPHAWACQCIRLQDLTTGLPVK